MKFLSPVIWRALWVLAIPLPASAGLPVEPSSASPTQFFEGAIRLVDDEGEEGKVVGFHFPLDRHSITFVPDGASGYHYFVQPINALPVDMSQASAISPPEEENWEVPVSIAPRSCPFYGISRTSFLVSHNGTISFDGSKGAGGSVEDHLQRRQIAALATDEHVRGFSGGLVRKLESNDKVTLHFEGLLFVDDAAEDSVYTSVFQAELFFDGRIRLSYFGVEFEDGIVGLANDNISDPNTFTQENFAQLQLLPQSSSAVESQSSVSIPVELTNSIPQAVTFRYTCHNLAAVSGSDFTAVTGTASIPANQTATSIQVPLLNDSRAEIGESFLLRLSHPTIPEWVYGECEVWIIDDEPQHPVPGSLADASPRIRQSGMTVYIEPGGAGTASFRIVSANGGSLKNPGNGSVFAPGATVSLAQGAAGLLCSGPDLYFTVEALDTPAGNRIGIASFDVHGESAATVFSFENVAVSAQEGQMATLVVKASGPGRAVYYEILPGTATALNGAAGDYLPTLVPLYFEYDQAVIGIPVFADQLTEGAEFFYVRLAGAGDGSFLGPDSLAKVSIADAEGPVRLPLAAKAAAPTAAEEPFWPGNIFDGIGNLTGYPGLFAPIISDGEWINVPIPEQAGSFTLTFEIETSDSMIDALIGLSENPVTSYTDISAMVRASPAGIWDAYDDTSFTHEGDGLIYAPLTPYRVTMRVDVPANTYHVEIVVGEDDPVVILEEGAFRRDALTLRYLTLKATGGAATTVSHVEILRHASSTAFQPQTGSFSIEFDLRLSGDAAFGFPDILIGLSGSSATEDSQMSALLSMAGEETSIIWQAWHGGPSGGYVMANHGYIRGDIVHVDFQVNVTAGTYMVTLTSLIENPDAPIHFGPFSFRAPAASLAYLHVVTEGLAYKITNLNGPPRAATDPSGGWINLPIPRQTGRFSISYEVETSGSPIDASCGLAAAAVTSTTDMSAVCRANPSGRWDGWKAGGFTQTTLLPYSAGLLYQVTLDVDVATDTYDLTITPPGSAPVLVLSQGTFRKAASSLNFVALKSFSGSLAIRNIGPPVSHPLDRHRHSTGKIDSTLGAGSGVAVADHAVLTAARLVFDEQNQAFSPDIIWKFRYQSNRPVSAWLITSYAAGALESNTQGTLASDAVDVAVLSFRPLKVPEVDNAPALGGYSGFLIDPNPNAGGNPWLGSGISRRLSYFPTLVSPFALEDDLQQTSATALSFTHLGRGVYSCSGLSAPGGTQGCPLFSIYSDGRYYPSAVCLGGGTSPPRFRVVDGLIAHTIYQANLVQQLYDSGRTIFLGGVEWDPEAMDPSILKTYGVISAENLPPAAAWELTTTTLDPQEQTRRSTGGKAISVKPGYYKVQLLPAQGYALTGNTLLYIGISAGQTFRIPGSSYAALAPTTYQGWVAQNYSAIEQAEPPSAPGAQTWLGVDNLTAYAFGFEPTGTILYPAVPNGVPPKPGLPVIQVNPATNPPTFKIDFLQRASSNLTYTVEFSDSPDGVWAASSAIPTVLALPGNADWKHFSLTTSPPSSPSKCKFARVKVTLNP